MKPFFFLVLILLLFSLPAFSQQRWERNYGGTSDDYGYSVQQTTDGGFIITGGTSSFGNGSQVYLIKTNASGDTLWSRSYGGANVERGHSVEQTQDGGYIVTGYTHSFGAGASDVYLIKTNTTGDTLWTRFFGRRRYDYGESVQQTQDGGYIVAGLTDLELPYAVNVYLIKMVASGDTLWTRTYGGIGDDYGWSAQQTQAGDYIITGQTDSFGDSMQVYLIKTNTSGDTIWTRTFGRAGSDLGYSVQQTRDTGYIITGYTRSFGNETQVYLIKTNILGDTLWTRNYGGAGEDYGRSVQQTSDGGYIIAGIYDDYGANPQVYLIKTNASGDTLWTRTFGGSGIDRGYSVQQTSDGGYIVAGETHSFGNESQVYLIKTDAYGSSGVETAGVRDKGLGIRVTAKPNPFTSFTTLPGHEAERFSLYDVSGRKVGTFKGDRIGEGLKTGVYFLRSSNSKDKPLRVVKVR